MKVVSGKIKVVTSHDDVERKEEISKKEMNKVIKGERHRIIRLKDLHVAEI
ncbi:MAG: hypothetical protein CM15mP75_0260 [Flammeovirgaceae bacterium]|nr:MAG: hypothetical protein CM15mP75_0260 [Flammeovirgaceae bacterium]